MPVTPEDIELLSAYLDNELRAKDRAALDSRLVTDPELRAALEDLRRTVALLRAAPLLRPPRDFTLDPARYRRPLPWWARTDWLRIGGALGAAASLALVVFGLLLAGMAGTSAPQANRVQATRLAEELATATQAVIAAAAVSDTPTPTATAQLTMTPTTTTTPLATPPAPQFAPGAPGQPATLAAAMPTQGAILSTPLALATATAAVAIREGSGPPSAGIQATPPSPSILAFGPTPTVAVIMRSTAIPTQEGSAVLKSEVAPTVTALIPASPTAERAAGAASEPVATVTVVVALQADEGATSTPDVRDLERGGREQPSPAATPLIGQTGQATAPQGPEIGARLLLVIGLVLLILSVLLLAVGWLRTRV